MTRSERERAARERAAERRELSRRILDGEGELQSLKQKQVERELELKAEISAELTEDGKPRFSNDVKRDVELLRRLSGDIGYQNVADRIYSFERQIKSLQADLRFSADSLLIELTFADAEPAGYLRRRLRGRASA